MLQFSTENERLIVSFSERLDSECCLKIQDELDEKIKEMKLPVVFDLRNVDYISSLFLGICMRLSKELGGDKFSIINVSPSVKKVFKIAKLDTFIDIK